MRQHSLKKGLVFWRQVSAYKGISLFSEDVDGPILIDILYVQLISNSTPNATSPTLHSLYTVLTHYSSVKKRWSWSHAQLLPTTQIHTILSGVHELVQKKEKKTMTEWQDCFVFVFFNTLLLSWESEAPPKSLPPASFHVWHSAVSGTRQC